MIQIALLMFQMTWMFRQISMNIFWERWSSLKMTQRFGAYLHGTIMARRRILIYQNRNYFTAPTFSPDLVGCSIEIYGMNCQQNGPKRTLEQIFQLIQTLFVAIISIFYCLVNISLIRNFDDWIRAPTQRKHRVCIRPEISRTRTFGKVGVSGYEN